MTGTELRRYRSALYVDFDNIYLGLRSIDEDAAEAFGSEPMTWLSWLSNGADDQGPFQRRFLVRTCYLNPVNLGRFRPFFTRAGFRVVDCPPLTARGKNSADINMVLDVMDDLSHPTRYEEFVIASADADFTPILTRLRAFDRRTTVVISGPAAAAYTAMCDSVITPEELATASLGEEAPEESPATDDDGGEGSVTLERAAEAVRAAVAEAESPLTSSAAAQAALRVDPDLATDGWGGHRSFGSFLRERVPELTLARSPRPGYVYDPARHTEQDLQPKGKSAGRGQPADAAEAPAPDEITDLQRQVSSVTGVPLLSQSAYGSLLGNLAADIGQETFSLTDTSKRVRDACVAQGHPIGRATVNFVIQGLRYNDVPMGPETDARALAEAWSQWVVDMCSNARMELDDAETAAIRTWVGTVAV